MLQMLFRLYPIICLARNSGGADCPCPVLLCFFINHEHCSAYLNEHYELTEEEIKEVMDGYDPSDKDNQSNLERMMQERAFSHLTE